eukprot:TRINITY_DN24321_c0_g1_i1.p1 TRINITY_DN24321_c0_g1~~TRINITY_DN24321_c0_g1_i1.p1  ORF type:complete len:117 (+),score=31.40 TRINITY_DN24321_c0_g1_i1:75-425(+)
MCIRDSPDSSRLENPSSTCYTAGERIAQLITSPVYNGGKLVYFIVSPVIWVAETLRALIGPIFTIVTFPLVLAFKLVNSHLLAASHCSPLTDTMPAPAHTRCRLSLIHISEPTRPY